MIFVEKNNKKLLPLFFLLLIGYVLPAQINTTCWGGGATDVTTINTTQGNTGDDGVRTTLNKGGNFQVKFKGQNQIFAPSNDSPVEEFNDPDGIPGTTQGIVFAIGSHYYTFGSLGNEADYAVQNNTNITGYTQHDGFTSSEVTHNYSCTSSGNTSTVVMTHNITRNSMLYVLKVTYDYEMDKQHMRATYEVTIPSGNTDPVKLAHGWDTYLGGSDQGPGKYVGGSNPQVFTYQDGSCNIKQGFRYVSGEPWSGYFADDYDYMDMRLANDMTFSNTGSDVTSTVNDKGVAISINFGTASGTKTSVNDLIFGQVAALSMPTLSSTSVGNNCPSSVQVTMAEVDVLVTNAEANGIVWYTDASKTTQVSFPITTSTTIYAALGYHGCTGPASDPITVTITNPCCELAGDVGPTVVDETLTNNCPGSTTLSIPASKATGTNADVANTIKWSKDGGTTFVDSGTALSAADSGAYSAYFVKNGDNTCYSNASTGKITVNITDPCPVEASIDSGNTQVTAVGGSGNYTYTNVSDDNTKCGSYSGSTSPTPTKAPSANVSVSGTGAITIDETGLTGGTTYFYCIEVCDDTTPTALCTIVQGEFTVAVPCAAGSEAPLLQSN